MQFSSKIALSLSFVLALASNSSAAPISEEKRESISFNPYDLPKELYGGFKGGDLHLRSSDLDLESRGAKVDYAYMLSAILGAASALKSRDVAESSELDVESRGAKVDYAYMLSAILGAANALKSRDLADQETNRLDARGKADYASLVSAILYGFQSIRSRDLEEEVEKRSPLNAAGIGSAIFAGTAIYNGIKNNYFSKEAVDEYLASLDNEAVSKRDPLNSAAMVGLGVGSLAKQFLPSKDYGFGKGGKTTGKPVQARDVDIETRSPLSAAGIGAAIFAGTSIYNGIKANYGSKAAEEFASALESRDVATSHPDLDLLGL